MTPKIAGLLVVFSIAGYGADVFMFPQNQTVLREQRGEIHTVFQDVRAPMIATMPGMGMYDTCQLRVGSTYSHAWWDGLLDEQKDQGRALDTTVLARLRLAGWCAFEIEAGVQDSQVADNLDLRNIDTRLAFTLFQARYTGVTLALGAAAPISSEGKVPGYNHENDFTRWSYLAEVRFTTNLGFNVLSLNVGGRWTPNALNEFEEGLGTEDGDPIASGPGTQNNYARLDGRAAWSYRPLRYVRAGLEYQLKWDTFELSHADPAEGDLDLTNGNHVGSVFVEVNPVRELAIIAHCGANFMRWNHGERADALVFGGILQATF